MAKQSGPVCVTGTIDGITYYKRAGAWLARKKSSLDKERVLNDPAFANSRKESQVFGEASRLASDIYALLPAEHKRQGVFGKITAKVKLLMKQDIEPALIQEELLASYR
ncbi:MAG: hypothetical protein QM687_06165 [Ferruginibacter sp.]